MCTAVERSSGGLSGQLEAQRASGRLEACAAHFGARQDKGTRATEGRPTPQAGLDDAYSLARSFGLASSAGAAVMAARRDLGAAALVWARIKRAGRPWGPHSARRWLAGSSILPRGQRGRQKKPRQHRRTGGGIQLCDEAAQEGREAAPAAARQPLQQRLRQWLLLSCGAAAAAAKGQENNNGAEGWGARAVPSPPLRRLFSATRSLLLGREATKSAPQSVGCTARTHTEREGKRKRESERREKN